MQPIFDTMYSEIAQAIPNPSKVDVPFDQRCNRQTGCEAKKVGVSNTTEQASNMHNNANLIDTTGAVLTMPYR
jgi:hypothetical protein